MVYSVKGRMTNAKVQEADVRRMRRLHVAGQASPRQLALEYGLATETVRKILRYETFAWVGEEGPGGVEPARLPATAEPDPARFLARLQAEGLAVGDAPTGEGLARLQAEATKLTRGDVLVKELESSGVNNAAFKTANSTSAD